MKLSLWKILMIILLLAGGVWVYSYVMTPPPGTEVEDQGREHVSAEEVRKTAYKSNPPTSGPHLATWVKAGIYSQPQSEGELIHSLEHGYVIINYNCGAHLSSRGLLPRVYAHEESSASGSSQSEPVATGSAITETQGCKTLIKNLTDLAEKKKLWKLIVVPRPQLDTTIALTAWNHIDKFDPPAGGIDSKRIEVFIDNFRDRGPEKTME